jgi:GT2 family glycosyltransferase
LDSLLAESPKVGFELIVVDDASRDQTPAMLRAYGDAIRVITHAENAGFAQTCNDGAATARGEYLVFLNNDTVPAAGWLDALVATADAEPRVGVVGSKLLFPDDTVQHAGVVVCQDGNPRHIYAGFPADHPAVNRARNFQAVTAASMLVRRDTFEQAGGFDIAFRNCLEDTDLCMRVGELGYQVRYCPESVVYHLESVSRGRRSGEIATAGRLFRERWGTTAERDDLRHYVADELLRIHYGDLYPLKFQIAPELAFGTGSDLISFIEKQSGRIADLLRETVRLTAHVADIDIAGHPGPASVDPPGGSIPASESAGLAGLAADAERLQLGIHAFQVKVANTITQLRGQNGRPSFVVGDRLSYLELKERIRAVVESVVPGGASVLVVSRGDEALLELGGRPAWHFPQEEDGTYAGRHPVDSEEAITMLERMRSRGADYLVIPEQDAWWLEHYAAFADHLAAYRSVTQVGGSCQVFRLETGPER